MSIRFWEQPRQPFIGLTIVAALGIVAADRWPAHSISLPIALCLTAAIVARRWFTPCIWLFVFGAFFVLHNLNYHNNASRMLSCALSSRPRPVRATGIVVTEPESKTSRRGTPRCQFRLALESLVLDGAPRVGGLMLVNWCGPPPIFGDRISLIGDVKNIELTRNPGQFDFNAYLHRSGIYSELRVNYPGDGAILSSGHGNRIIAFSQTARRWMQRQLSRDLENAPEIAGLIQSLVLGLKEETPDATRELFQRTGTLHLFVVNGLHVGMLATIAWFLLRPTRLGKQRSIFVIIPLLAFYALLTGLSPGSIRATIMATVVLGGFIVEREPFSFNNLAAAAFAILAWDTNELFMPGFQFSFGVVFAIILFAGRFQRFFSKYGQPDPFVPRVLWSPIQNAGSAASKHLAGLCGVSSAAWIGSLGFTVTYFHLLSPNAVVTNVVVVPMAFVVLTHGILSLLAATFSTSLATVFNNVNWLVTHGILGIVQWFAAMPGGHFFVELPTFKSPPLCELTVFDLGAGGAVHLRSGSRDWLIDCGSDFGYENIVRPYLRTRGVNRLDGLVLTHGDVAHIGGGLVALDDFFPRSIVETAMRDRSQNRRAFHTGLADRQLGKNICEPGDVLQIAPDVTLRVLFPPAGLSARVADDRALVLQLLAGSTRVLLMSDSGFLTERWLLDHEPDLKSDVLIKGKHASDISGTSDFLNAVRPEAIVCTSTSFPPSEQITAEWASDIAAREIRLLRQDETGAVRVEITRDELTARAFLTDQIFRKSRR